MELRVNKTNTKRSRSDHKWWNQSSCTSSILRQSLKTDASRSKHLLIKWSNSQLSCGSTSRSSDLVFGVLVQSQECKWDLSPDNGVYSGQTFSPTHHTESCKARSFHLLIMQGGLRICQCHHQLLPANDADGWGDGKIKVPESSAEDHGRWQAALLYTGATWNSCQRRYVPHHSGLVHIGGGVGRAGWIGHVLLAELWLRRWVLASGARITLHSPKYISALFHDLLTWRSWLMKTSVGFSIAFCASSALVIKDTVGSRA